MDYRLELIAVPVSDVDRSKAFYERLGFRVDEDRMLTGDIRFVRLTPAGSTCSIAIGTGIVKTAPGDLHGLVLTVADAAAAQDDLRRRGVDVTDVQTLPLGRFAFFSDPDGNRWELMEPAVTGDRP